MKNHRVSILSALLALAPALGARADGGQYGSDEMSPDAPVLKNADGKKAAGVIYIDEETEKLKDAVADPTLSQGAIYAQAGALFGALPRRDTTKIGTLDLRGWDKPDARTKGGVDGMLDRVESVFDHYQAVYKEPPPPYLIQAYGSGVEMRSAGKMKIDEHGEVLSKTQLGAFVYQSADAVGIFFNRSFHVLQRYLGDGLAAATLIHESDHRQYHKEGQLNPVEVKKGEVHAFWTEDKWIRMIDPRGEKLAYAHHNYCGDDSRAPEIVCTYVKHLLKIRQHAEKDDLKGLVDELGYADGHFHGDGHDHAPRD